MHQDYLGKNAALSCRSACHVHSSTMSTEDMIATISSKHPEVDAQVILELLISCDANVSAVLRLLDEQTSSNGASPPLVTRQSTLKRFFQPDTEKSSATKRTKKTGENTIINKSSKSRTRVIHAYSPDQVQDAGIPCTFHLDVFPKDLADRLLAYLVKEADTWYKRDFYLFGRKVNSPHSSAMYSSSSHLLSSQKALYNGANVRQIRQYNQDMEIAGQIVEQIVQREIVKRASQGLEFMPVRWGTMGNQDQEQKHYQDQKRDQDTITEVSDKPNSKATKTVITTEKARYRKGTAWHCDVVLANCYADRTESVGFHADQLTHIGPGAVIASVSLGVTREFRLVPKLHNKSKKSKSQNDQLGEIIGGLNPISVHLPHNSLIIMHAGCQEAWKHSLMPSSSTFTPHPISGQKRLNLTYRMYLTELSEEKIPRCHCQRPMILRAIPEEGDVGHVKVDSSEKKGVGAEPRTITSSSPKEHLTYQDYRYLWQCSSSYANESPCTFSAWFDPHVITRVPSENRS